MIGRTVSHYKIVEEIGGGGMGVVYKAEDTKLNCPRALKFIHPFLIADEQLKRRFIREAQAASTLDHPNICSIHQVDETPGGRPFICMTYYDGASLSERVKEAPLPAREVFQIGFSIAQGLACAHRNGIIHRDVKPGNVIITNEGFVKIVDFGLAKLAGQSKITQSGATVGTVRYMSPEQATGKDVDHRTDIWSLGVIMYELATGRLPFRGDADPAVVYAMLHEDATPVHQLNPDMPASCVSVISRCLEKDAEQRYQSVEELLDDMNELAREVGWGSSIGGLTVPALESGVGRRRARRRHRLRGALIAAAVVAIAAVIVWRATRPPSLFTTDVRLAVMPLENKTHPSRDNLIAGLTDVLYNMLDRASREHESMWVVPNRLVRYADLATVAGAGKAFGVNRVVTGDVQRFADRQMLLLELRDADTLERLRTVSIPFDADSPGALSDSLPGAVVSLLDLGRGQADGLSPLLPPSPPAIKHYLEGVGALQANNAGAAIASLASVYSELPEFAPARTALGRAYWLEYRGTGEDEVYNRSIRHLEAAADLAPRAWQPRFHLGDIYRMTGEIDRAISVFNAVLEDDPGNTLVCRRLSDAYSRQERNEEAERTLKAAIKAYPDYFETHRLLAGLYYRIGEAEAMLQALRVSEALAPEDAYTYNLYGVLYHDQGEYTEARRAFEHAFQLLPTCQTCSNVGLMLHYEGRYEDSAEYYEYALEYCGRDNHEVWTNWARSLYWVEGQRDRSKELFGKAIQLASEALQTEPKDPYLIGNLIESYAMTGDSTSALRMIARAESLGTKDAELLYSIGDAYEIMGDRNAALRYLSAAARHGFPVERIRATRELQDLVSDSRFKRMVATQTEEEGSPPATSE